MTQIPYYFVSPKLSPLFSSFFILSSTTDILFFANSVVSLSNRIRVGRQYFARGLGFCQRINLSPGGLLNKLTRNYRWEKKITDTSIMQWPLHQFAVSIASIATPLWNRKNYFEISFRTKYTDFFSHDNSWSCFIHESF